ncbi:MAG: hypothetical protein ACLFNP_01295 [Spirochaetaceae bacterium]
MFTRFRFLLFFGILITAAAPFTASSEEEETGEEELPAEPRTEDTRALEPTLDLDAVGVRVQPQLEFVIPYGVISQSADIPIGQSVVSTKADFDLAASAVAGEVGLSRRFGNWEPGLRGYQRSNTEGIAQPRIAGDEVRLLPDERYLERERGVVGDLNWYVRENLVGNGALELTESIETLLSEPPDGEEIRESQFEIIPSISMELRSLRIPTPGRSADIQGSYLRFTLSQRHIDRFSNPVVLSGGVATLLSLDPLPRINVEHQLSATTPLYVYNRELLQPLSLGGFDSLRGFDSGNVTETRGFLARNTVSWRPAPEKEAAFDSPVVGEEDETVKVRIHNFKALLAVDALVAQEEPELESEVSGYLGTGPGAAVTVSAGESVHFDLRAYLVWPVGYSEIPVFYLQGAIFSVATD